MSILDAPASITTVNGLSTALRSVSTSVVAGNVNNFNGSTKAVATAGVYDTTRSAHTNLTGKTIVAIAVVYANYGQAVSTEVANPNQIQVQAAYEPLSPNGVDTQDQPRSQFSFGGLLTFTLDRRATCRTDFLPVLLPPGTSFFIRTGVTSTVNSGSVQRGICTRGGATTHGISNGEGLTGSANRVADAAGTVTPSAATACYSPSAILGITADGTIARSVAIVGDSISAGTDDAGFGFNYGGWPIRAFGSYPHVYVPIAGEKMADFANRTNSHSRFQIASLCSTIHCAYGRNDIEQGRTLAQFKADVLTVAAWFMAQGKRFIQATILPAPTSTDGFFTVANQTPQASTQETLRVQMNQWIRDTSASGFVAQANAQMVSLGVTRAGDAAFSNPCSGIECNSSGVLQLDGGYVLGSQSALLDSGTSSGTNTAATFNDTSKTWTTNQHKGKALYIVSGTGLGQSRTIGYNTTTQLGILNSFSVTPDATSVYRIFDAVGMNGVHPLTTGHTLAAASINAASLVL